MLSPISNNAMPPEAVAASKPSAASAPEQPTMKSDSVSISSQGHAAAAGDVDHDGDSH